MSIIGNAVEKAAYTVSQKSRKHKFDQFFALLAPTDQETIADVGVNVVEYSDSDNYLERHYPHPEKITAVGTDDTTAFSDRYPSVRYVRADGRKLPFNNDAFDIFHSNAVIEHVGSRQDQEAFVREAIRIAGRGFMTTPNRYFPIETHTRVPLLHLILPKRFFDAFLRLIGKGWATGTYMNLLSKRDVRALFEASGVEDFVILENRLFGIPMTFTAIWHKHSEPIR
jgi:hypothetical protein